MTEFVKIKGSYYQLDHIIAVTKVRTFKDASGKSLQYVVRLSEQAAGGDNPKFRNKWCTKAEVEPFLRKMKGLPENDDEETIAEEERSQNTITTEVSNSTNPELR
jgi:hypothetical protein